MKHQQVTVDYWKLVTTSLTYLALIASAVVLFRLAYAVFTLPRALKRNQMLVEQKLRECEIRIKEKRLEEEKRRSKMDAIAGQEPAAIVDAQPQDEVSDQEIQKPTLVEEEPKKEL